MTRRIKLLGGVTIEEEGRPLRLMNSAHGLALVAYLVYCNEIQSRERVADLLWDASSTRRSLMRLRELLVRVRQWLPQIQTSRKTVVFCAEKDDVVDLFLLRDALAGANGAELDRALRLYEGDFLANFYLSDAPYFNEWLVVVRERLRMRVLDAHHRLCQQYSEAGKWGDGVGVARRWVALEPFDEVAHRWLMHMLARNGQITAALQAYESCRQIVRRQLGVEPEAETSALAQALERLPVATPAPGVPDVSPLIHLASGKLPAKGSLPVNSIVPYQRNVDFVGREVALLEIATLLGQAVQEGRRPVVTITGIGGVGKTQTAVEFCYRYGHCFPGGVFWMNFADVAKVADEVARMGSERGMGLFGEREAPARADRVARVQRAWQEQVPRLLVFDDCADEALLAEWLPVSGGCCVVLTSRRAAWARALGVETIGIKPLAADESSVLLARMARHVGAKEREAIAAAVGHLPLALYLAGGFLNRYRHIEPATIARQLREGEPVKHPSLRGRGVGYSPTGHVLDVARTYAASWRELDPADEVDVVARQLLACAACLPADAPIPVAWLKDVVCPDRANGLLAEDSLSRLLSTGFLTRTGDQTVVLHPLPASFTRVMCGAEEMAWARAAVARQSARSKRLSLDSVSEAATASS